MRTASAQRPRLSSPTAVFLALHATAETGFAREVRRADANEIQHRAGPRRHIAVRTKEVHPAPRGTRPMRARSLHYILRRTKLFTAFHRYIHERNETEGGSLWSEAGAPITLFASEWMVRRGVGLESCRIFHNEVCNGSGTGS